MISKFCLLCNEKIGIIKLCADDRSIWIYGADEGRKILLTEMCKYRFAENLFPNPQKIANYHPHIGDGSIIAAESVEQKMYMSMQLLEELQQDC